MIILIHTAGIGEEELYTRQHPSLSYVRKDLTTIRCVPTDHQVRHLLLSSRVLESEAGPESRGADQDDRGWSHEKRNHAFTTSSISLLMNDMVTHTEPFVEGVAKREGGTE